MDQEKIWDYYQNNDDIGNFAFNADTRYRFIADRVSAEKKALNIGVGRGGLEALLLEKGVDVYCLDPSSDSINAIRKRFGVGERAQAGYSQKMPFTDGAFDVVIMSEVLEHLSDDVLLKTIDEIKRVLRAGGVFIGTVPADENLKDSLVVCPCCGNSFHRWGHVQSFSQDRIRRIFGEKFEIQMIDRHYFGNFKNLNWKGKLSLLLKLALLKVGISGSGETWFFMMKKPV